MVLNRKVIPEVALIHLLLVLHGAAWGSEADLNGASIYNAHCARCHQNDGQGIPGKYPSLHASSDIWQDRSRAIVALLTGREAAQAGQPDMPTHGYLGNEIIAATLTYAMQQWGPGGVGFSTEEVADQRMKLIRGHQWQYFEDVSGSPLGDLPALDERVTSAGPPMTTDEFQRARSLYYSYCTGCHGVLRQGTAGTPLTPSAMRERGTEYLKAVINYGAISGMPDWGTGGALKALDVDLLARFLQHEVPKAPDLDAAAIRATWRVHTPKSERPEHSQHPFSLDDLFAVMLHDPAQIAFIHGPTRKIIATTPVGRAPHKARLSASGRYLYVISRDGTLTLIDLYFAKPRRVAEVRVGYEARAVGVSRFPGYQDRYALAGAYWPAHLVLMDGETLEPLEFISTRAEQDEDSHHPEPRVTDVAGSMAHPEFIAHIKETGRTYLIPYARRDTLEPARLESPGELRAGRYAIDQRHYLTPSDRNAVLVLDTVARSFVASVPARVFSGSVGTTYVDPDYGPVWLTSTLTTDDILVIATDAQHRREVAWQAVHRLKGPGTGSLFSASHPRSHHVWIDTPLSSDAPTRQSVAVFDKNRLENGHRRLAIAETSGIKEGPRHALQPTFDATGREVWVLVYNPAHLASAIVIIDDQTLEARTVLRDPLLTTPIRIYNMAQLAQETGSREPGARAGAALYQENCAVCHGTYGEGDGALSQDLAVVLQDLRYLSARNEESFPRRFVTRIVRGNTALPAHGPAGMPAWGEAFARNPSDEWAPEQKIKALVDYLEAIQLPAAK